jgi:hypothetical protein
MRLLAAFCALPVRARTAVVLTAALTLAGLAFACFAPHLPVPRRAARAFIDLVVLAGIVAYVFDPPAARVTARKPSLRWLIAVGFTVAAIAFIAIAPGIDWWLRAYRLTLGGIVLAAIAFQIQRPAPKGWLRRVVAVQCAVVAVEFVTAMYVAMSVDIPITMASAGAISRSIAARLQTSGIPEPGLLRDERVRRALPPNALTIRNGRVFATPLLADEFHAVRNDPFAAALAVVAALPSMRIAYVSPDRMMCVSFNAIDPPAGGYLTAAMREEIRELRTYCANQQERA